MPRGENEEFQKRVGRLSEPLIKKNLEQMIEKRTDFSKDKVDLESLVDSTLCFEENLEVVESHLESDLSSNPENNPQLLESELKRYEYEWNKYMERHNISESELK